jgi:hypothetical protein
MYKCKRHFRLNYHAYDDLDLIESKPSSYAMKVLYW